MRVLDRPAVARFRTLFLLLAFAALALTFGPAYVRHVANGSNPSIFNDDVRQQIFPFFKDVPGGPTGVDLPGQYQLDLMPVGFKALYWAFEPFVDPATISKVLPYALAVVLWVALGLSARILAGDVAMIVTLALALQTTIFFERLMGGMPRSFAFPMIALGLWATLSGRVRTLAILAIAAQAFYSVAAAVLALMLAVLLLLMPAEDRGTAVSWTFVRRVRLLVVVGALMVAIAIPVLIASRPYGRLLGPGDHAAFPEMGPDGRFDREDRVPVNRVPTTDLWVDTANIAERTLSGGGPPLVAATRELGGRHASGVVTLALASLGAGLIVLAWRSTLWRRAAALPLAGLCGFCIARVFAPYLYVPQRYLFFTVPIVLVVLLPALMAAIAESFAASAWKRTAHVAGAVVAGAIVLLLFGGRGDAMSGYTITVPPEARLYTFLASLPSDALIAGWPGGPIDDVPYVSRRRAFVTKENHMVFHERYVLEMRERMRALIRGRFGDATALAALRDRYGVTHLLVAPGDLTEGYFQPFETEIEALQDSRRRSSGAVSPQSTGSLLFSEDGLEVFDLGH